MSFQCALMDKYFGSYFPNLGINRNQFLSLGRMLPDDDNEPFKMPVLAIKLSSYINGVSNCMGRYRVRCGAACGPASPRRKCRSYR